MFCFVFTIEPSESWNHLPHLTINCQALAQPQPSSKPKLVPKGTGADTKIINSLSTQRVSCKDLIHFIPDFQTKCLFYETLKLYRSVGDHNCPNVVSRDDWEEAAEESWRLSASLPLAQLSLRALVRGERVTESSGYSYQSSAWSDHHRRRSPHIQTSSNENSNRKKKKWRKRKTHHVFTCVSYTFQS